jgi:hypothetical protein
MRVLILVLMMLGFAVEAGAQVNAAQGKPVTASGPLWSGFPVTNLTDGLVTTFTHPLAASGTLGFRYEVNLQASRNISAIRIFNRDNCCPERLTNYRVSVHADNGAGAAGAAVWSAVVRGNGTNSGLGGMDEVLASAHPAGTFTGQWVRLENLSNAAYNPQLAEIQVWTDDIAVPNLALNKPVTASGAVNAGMTASNLTDGNPLTVGHPASGVTTGFFWQVDLLRVQALDRVVIYQRADCCPERLRNYRVTVHGESGGVAGPAVWTGDVRTDLTFAGPGEADTVTAAMGSGVFSGRYVRIANLGGDAFSPQIAEVEVYRAPPPRVGYFAPDTGNITATGNPAMKTEAVLSWRVDGADSVTIDRGVGVVTGSGKVTVRPSERTVYTLTAANAVGSVTAVVTVAVDAEERPVRINEFVADNGGVVRDEDGDASDWIELYNSNDFTVNLAGMGLSDNPEVLRKWVFPSVAVGPGGYLVVYASGKDRADGAAALHTNFQLSRAGETLTLSGADGVVVDRVPEGWPMVALYPEQSPDTGYGRNASGAWRYFRPATPGAVNVGEGFAGVVADTKFLPRRGVFSGPQMVAITCETPGAVIRYTRNGTVPTETTGTLYSGPVAVSTSTVIRAAAFAAGLAPTNVDTHSYILPETVASQPGMVTAVTGNAVWGPQIPAALRDLPVVSVATPSTAAINNDAEVAGNVEWLDSVNGASASAGMGLTYFGGAFTNFAKKSFRLYFRDNYGAPRLEAPLFAGADHGTDAVTSFDSIELRSGSHDMVDRGFYMSNLFTDQAMMEMGHVSPHGRMVHLFLNGTYWGMYHLRERWNAAMMADYLGGSKDEYEAINGNYNVGGWPTPGQAYDGTGAGWERAKGQRTSYAGIRPLVDVTNYIDYMITWMFGNSEDEYRCAGFPGPGSGLKFLMNDADGWLSVNGSNSIAAWDGSDNNTARASTLTNGVFSAGRSPGDGPGAIFAGLLLSADPEYRILLADRINQHLGAGGTLSSARNTARLNAMCGAVQRAMIAESARWNYRLPDNWTGAWNVCRNSWMPGRTTTVMNQFRSAGLLPAVNAPVFGQHGGNYNPGFTLTVTGPAGATIFYTTDGSDPRVAGGALAATARTYSGPLNLSGNTWVRARCRNGAVWSGMTAAFFQPAGASAVPAGSLVVSELHFNPSGDDASEFIELMNASAVESLNLRGCRFAGGVGYQFSPWRDVVLGPGQRLVLAGSDLGLRRVYGWDRRIEGKFRDNLSNGGEALVLQAADGATVMQVTWDGAWSPLADGGGHSLVLVRPRAGMDLSVATNWRASTAAGGVPGGSDAGVAFVGDGGADGDGDGLSALMEYALGSSDGVATGEPVTVESGGPVRFRYVRAAAADDAVLVPQIGEDPAGPWLEGAAVLRVVAETVRPDGRVEVTVEARPGVLTGAARGFVRLRVAAR